MLTGILGDFYLFIPGYFFVQSGSYGLCLCWPSTHTLLRLIILTLMLELLVWSIAHLLFECSLIIFFTLRAARVLWGKQIAQSKKYVSLLLTSIPMPINLRIQSTTLVSLAKYLSYLFTYETHREFFFSLAGYKSVYSDSGVWDTFLLVSFDKVYRVVFIYTILPLSENNIVEKMSVKISAELTQNKLFSILKKNLTLGHMLHNLVVSLGFIFFFIMYILGCTL